MNTRISVLRSGLCPIVLAISMAIASAPRNATAAPWDLISFKHIEADPNKSYAVAESDGPWMIMVTTFHGDKAELQAQQLVLELRKQNSSCVHTPMGEHTTTTKSTCRAEAFIPTAFQNG